MASRVAAALGGYGNVPGYGKVTPPKKKPGIGGELAGLGAWAAPPPVFKPMAAQSFAPPPVQTPAASGVLPVDAGYDQTISALQRRRDDTVAGLKQQRTGTLLDFGYNVAGTDAAGNATGLAFDPSNPNSRAALAKKHYDQSKSGTTNSLAARGQLNSGAYLNAQGENDSGYQQTTDSMQKALLAFLGKATQAEKSAMQDYEIGAGQAYGDRVARAQASAAQAPPSAPPPAEAAAPSAPAAPSTADLIKKWQNLPYQEVPGKDSKGHPGIWHVYFDGRPRVFIRK